MIPTSAPVIVTAPGTSSGPVSSGALDSGTCRSEMATTAAASGRLMKKIKRHDTALISQPPINGPTAVARPPSPDQAPMAFDRSSLTKEACRMERLPGVSSAAPTPWMARARMSVGALGATPHSSEARANQTVPMRKTLRRPYRSPRVPPSSSSPASESV